MAARDGPKPYSLAGAFFALGAALAVAFGAAFGAAAAFFGAAFFGADFVVFVAVALALGAALAGLTTAGAVAVLASAAALAAAASARAVLLSAARADSGYYSLLVTNVAGSITSSNALLHVLTPQRILPLTSLGGGQYRLSFSDFDGGLLFDWDLGNLAVEGSTDLSATNWITLTNAIVISNGVGQVEFVATNNPPHQFYRIRMK